LGAEVLWAWVASENPRDRGVPTLNFIYELHRISA
jgi:hypothetical protein